MNFKIFYYYHPPPHTGIYIKYTYFILYILYICILLGEVNLENIGGKLSRISEI